MGCRKGDSVGALPCMQIKRSYQVYNNVVLILVNVRKTFILVISTKRVLALAILTETCGLKPKSSLALAQQVDPVTSTEPSNHMSLQEPLNCQPLHSGLG